LLIDNTIPNVICTDCVQNLSLAVTLRRQLIESEHNFRIQMFKGLNKVETNEQIFTDTKETFATEENSVNAAVLKTIKNCISELPSSVQIEKVPFLPNKTSTKCTSIELPAKITISSHIICDNTKEELNEYIDLPSSALLTKNDVLFEIDEHISLKNIIINFVEGPEMQWNEPCSKQPVNFKVSQSFKPAMPKQTVQKVNVIFDERKVGTYLKDLTVRFYIIQSFF
jgi:hypothetical protein